jgi:hypothetical protein
MAETHRAMKGDGIISPLVQPEFAWPTCWRAWLNSRPRKALGYCWHGSIAWRVRPNGEFIAAAGVDRVKHLTIVRELEKREPQGFNAH